LLRSDTFLCDVKVVKLTILDLISQHPMHISEQVDQASDEPAGRRPDEPADQSSSLSGETPHYDRPNGGAVKQSRMNAPVGSPQKGKVFVAFVPDQLIFGLRSSCDRAEFMLALPDPRG
jgi:hypothetical protein